MVNEGPSFFCREKSGFCKTGSESSSPLVSNIRVKFAVSDLQVGEGGFNTSLC